MNPLSLFKGRQKKGQIGIPNTVLAGVGAVFGLFLIGVFIFAFAIAGAEMGDTAGTGACGGFWNTTSKGCQVNSTNQTALPYDDSAVNVIDQTVAGASALANFSPVLWIITGIGILIGLLLTFVGGFLFVQSMKDQ